MLVRDAAEQVRRGALPQNAEAYQAKTSPSFQVPQGVEFALDANDPLWPQAKTWAKEVGLSQEQFEKAIDLVAGRDLFNHQQVQTARAREIEKLGPTAASRVDAIETFYKGILGEQAGKLMTSRMFNAADVAMHEKLISKFATQGHASFSAAHREPGGAQGRLSNEEYAKLTPGEKFNYARQFNQAQVQKAS